MKRNSGKTVNIILKAMRAVQYAMWIATGIMLVLFLVFDAINDERSFAMLTAAVVVGLISVMIYPPTRGINAKTSKTSVKVDSIIDQLEDRSKGDNR